jgi:hypothetical protein
MKVAEQALLEAATDIPADVRGRLDTADKLSDEDRKEIVEIARKALEGFSPRPDSKAEQEQKSGDQPKPKGSTPEPESEAKQKSSVHPASRVKAGANVEPKPGSKPEQKPAPKQRADEQTQGKSQAKPESNPGAMSDEANAEPKPQTTPKEKP